MIGASCLRATLSTSRAAAARQIYAASSRPSITLLAANSTTGSQQQTRSIFSHSRAPPSPFTRVRQFTYLVLTLAGGTLAVAYYLDSRSGIHRWVVTPLLKAFTDPETAQKLAIKVLESGLAPRDLVDDDPVLETELFGKKISNPVGLAAGFDKQAQAIDGLLNLGFGFIEVGSVTPEPQPGNPQPRYFRLIEDEAAINRFGFNSEGHSVVLSRLRDRVRKWLLHTTNIATLQDALSESSHQTCEAAEKLLAGHPKSNSAFIDASGLPRSLHKSKLLAINLGKNKTSKEENVDDYLKGVERLGPYADFIVINVSSPNTPGLRRLQRRGVLEDLLTQLVKARDTMVASHANPSKDGKRVRVPVPLLVKIAPDLSEDELHDVADAAINSGIDGLVISNTTISRPASLRSSEHVRETGGLSGPPVKPLALKALETVYKRLRGELPIIGCGGISSAEDALEFAKAGASAIELYTSFGYNGVGLARHIKDELTELLKAEGKTWKEVVGSGIKLTEQTRSVPNDSALLHGVESVKQELEGMLSKLEHLNPNPHPRSQFIPDRTKDADYYSLLQKAHAALGLSFSEQNTQGAEINVVITDKTKHIHTDRIIPESQLEAQASDFGNVDNRRVV